MKICINNTHEHWSKNLIYLLLILISMLQSQLQFTVVTQQNWCFWLDKENCSIQPSLGHKGSSQAVKLSPDSSSDIAERTLNKHQAADGLSCCSWLTENFSQPLFSHAAGTQANALEDTELSRAKSLDWSLWHQCEGEEEIVCNCLCLLHGLFKRSLLGLKCSVHNMVPVLSGLNRTTTRGRTTPL